MEIDKRPEKDEKKDKFSTIEFLAGAVGQLFIVILSFWSDFIL